MNKMFIEKCLNCGLELNIKLTDAYVCPECGMLMQTSYIRCKECGGELLEMIFGDDLISYWCRDGCGLMTGE